MEKDKLLDYLRDRAREIRIHGLEMITAGQVGHPGATLSEADILAALYYSVLKIDSKNPKWEDRDRFVLSKGHGVPALYAVLGMKGYFDWDDLMKTYGHLGSHYQAHPDMNKTPGIEITAGSLGQGLSLATGMAKAAQDDGKLYRIYCMVGDGECDEGQIWEAAMAAAHYKLDNLTVIVDYNKVQAKGAIHDIMRLEPLADKWRSFGWDVIEIDGHNMEEILDAFYEAKYLHNFGRPVAIIAHTVKGKGVSFMEDTPTWHTSAPNPEQLAAAIKELNTKEEFAWTK